MNNIGQILGPLIGTWLAGKQIFAPFMMSGGPLIIPVLVFILWNKGRRNQEM